MSDFESIRKDLTHRMESLLVDMDLVTRPDGIKVNQGGNLRVLVRDFNTALADMERGYNSTETIMVPAIDGENNHE